VPGDCFYELLVGIGGRKDTREVGFSGVIVGVSSLRLIAAQQT
jgi:hypothetical protein